MVTKRAIDAVGGVCQIQIEGICTRIATQGHHRLPRAQGGKDTVDNCLPTCSSCHDYIHAHPAEAYANGWMVQKSSMGKDSQ